MVALEFTKKQNCKSYLMGLKEATIASSFALYF